jgi:hypothetical protein
VSDTIQIDMDTFRQIVQDLAIDRPIAAAHQTGNVIHVFLTGNNGQHLVWTPKKPVGANPRVRPLPVKAPTRSKK